MNPDKSLEIGVCDVFTKMLQIFTHNGLDKAVLKRNNVIIAGKELQL